MTAGIQALSGVSDSKSLVFTTCRTEGCEGDWPAQDPGTVGQSNGGSCQANLVEHISNTMHRGRQRGAMMTITPCFLA